MGALKRIHPLPPAVYTRPNRIDTASSVSSKLLDRAARSPFHCGMGHVGVRVRAPMLRGVCDGLKLPCGAALAHWPGAHTAMCAGGVPVPLSILLLLLLFTSATEHVEMFVRLGVVCLFGSLSTGCAKNDELKRRGTNVGSRRSARSLWKNSWTTTHTGQQAAKKKNDEASDRRTTRKTRWCPNSERIHQQGHERAGRRSRGGHSRTVPHVRQGCP